MAEQVREWYERLRAPIRVRGFRWLLLSNIAFFVAIWSQQVVRAWLAFELTGSELALGSIVLATALPMLLIAPLGGVVADRVERRRLVLVGQAVAAVNQSIVLVLIVLDTLALWHLMASALVMGCVIPFIMPARQSMVFNVVGADVMTSALAVNGAALNATRLIGPAAGGVLIARFDVSGAYAAGVALFVASFAFMLRVERFYPRPDPASGSIFESMFSGFAYMVGHRTLVTVLLFGLVPMTLVMPFQNLLTVFTERVWDAGAEGLGIISAALGAGGITGSLWVASRREGKRWAGMMLCMFGVCVLVFLFSLCDSFWIATGLVFLANILASAFSTLNNASIQLLVPDSVRGRISSFFMMTFALPLAGTIPLAFFAERIGIQAAVGASALLGIAATLGFYLFGTSLRRLDAEIGATIAGTAAEPTALEPTDRVAATSATAQK